jgi:hypothetical protein
VIDLWPVEADDRAIVNENDRDAHLSCPAHHVPRRGLITGDVHVREPYILLPEVAFCRIAEAACRGRKDDNLWLSFHGCGLYEVVVVRA